MFLGVSHFILTINNQNTTNIIDLLVNLGYEVDFSENRLKNNSEKYNFMSCDNKYHNITFLKHKSRIAIEVIEYKEVKNIKSNMILSFESKIDSKDKEVNKILEYTIYYNEVLKIEYFISCENDFIIKVQDEKKEIKFWNDIGFKNLENRINIKSPLKQWKGNLYIIYDNCEYNYMDNIGVNTLCLLTNDIQKDSQKIKVDTKSDIFSMKVNNKNMKNMLVQQDNYNIELLEIK